MSNQAKFHPSHAIGWLEQHLCRQAPELVIPRHYPQPSQARLSLRDGMTIAIIGGGLAGPIFARQLLRFTKITGVKVRIVIFDQTDCNYCAGLMTDLSKETLQTICDLEVPKEVILTEIDGCIYVNAHGSSSVMVEKKLVSMLRTDRFGEAGFDDAFKYRLLKGIEEYRDHLQIIEPVTVSEVHTPTAEEKGWVSYRLHGEKRRMEADILVVASGLRSLQRPMLNDFIAHTGFVPPKIMGASVTEVDATQARYNHMQGKALIADNIIPKTMIGIIAKRPNWITVSTLQHKISKDDVETLFAHPQVKRWIDIPNPSAALRCQIICPANVCVSTAENFYGDNWLVIGDLTGYQRALKDGYFACMVGGNMAAQCLAFHGAGRDALRQNYHKPLERAFSPRDNKLGMGLFYLNEKLAHLGWFPPLLMQAARHEEKKSAYGGLVHSALRALLTGEISYSMLTVLLVSGLIKYYFPRPGSLFRHLLGKTSHETPDNQQS